LLTPEQARSAADALAENARRETIELRNARARPIPFFVQSPKLRALEPWQQAELFKQASRKVNASWVVIWISLAWFAICIALWWLLGVPHFRGLFPVAFVLFVGVPLWARNVLVRRELVALASASSPGEDGGAEV